ncbi:hypothetical protein B0T19DRAFT_470487 [Cercophora scortea]|uniref:Uncharacterized protein n=1 Tax=Cercophora scortea TaxID=314031 RepID=A0AAE0J1F1_9PEZI|nr:hypothetical protein B0T19DRAFT_470487 [Cercophora scortea]
MNKEFVSTESGAGDDRAAVVSRFANLETTGKIQDDSETCRILVYAIKTIASPLHDGASCESTKNAVKRTDGNREKGLLHKGHQDSVYPAEDRDAITGALDVFEPSCATLDHRHLKTDLPWTASIWIWDTDIEESIWLSPTLLLLAVIGSFAMGSWESSQRQEGLTAAGFVPRTPDADWVFVYATPATLIIAIATTTLSLTWYHYLQGLSRCRNLFIIAVTGVGVLPGALAGYTGTETLLQLVPLSVVVGLLLVKAAEVWGFGDKRPSDPCWNGGPA